MPSASSARTTRPRTFRTAALTAVVGLGFIAVARAAEPTATIANPPAVEPAPAADTRVAPSPTLEAILAPLTQERLFREAHVGLQVVNVATGQEVFARSADDSMVPASTMKVVTAAAALRTLGPAWRFTTDVYIDGEIDAQGVLDGNMYIQGHGDPTFTREKLWKLVSDLRLEGITKIDGDIIYDEGFFDTDYELPGWDKKEDEEEGPTYFPPLGALSINYNTVGFVVRPGAEIGRPASVVLETPAGDAVEIDNQLVTVSTRGRHYVDIDRELVDPKKKTEHLKFTLRGTVPSDADNARYYRAVIDPTAVFIGTFREQLQAQGVAVTGRHKRGTTPTTAKLFARDRSDSLSILLAEMNKHSNNFIAEQVIKAMGAEAYGLPGTSEKGLRVVADYLTSLGIDASQYSLRNGSGLSRTMLLRPSVLTAVLVDMGRDRRVGAEFTASLAIAGEDGTLWRRLTEDPGRLRGKTGTIDGVHCLVGYVEGSDGEMYAFAFLVNGVRGDSSQVKRLHDRFARRMFTVGQGGPEVVEGGEESP